MKKKWWIVLIIVVILLIGGGIAWYFVHENNLPECEKEYEYCLEQEAMGVYIDCIPCGAFNHIELMPESKSECEKRYESCLIDKEAGANILCEPCDYE